MTRNIHAVLTEMVLIPGPETGTPNIHAVAGIMPADDRLPDWHDLVKTAERALAPLT